MSSGANEMSEANKLSPVSQPLEKCAEETTSPPSMQMAGKNGMIAICMNYAIGQ